MNKILISFLMLLLLTSCTARAVPEPTATNTLEASPTPEATNTPAPTSTATSEPTVAPSIDFGPDAIKTQVVSEGFTISVPLPLRHQVNKNIVLIADEEQTLNISFATDQMDDAQTLTDIIDIYLASLEKRGGQFEKSEPVDIEVDGIVGAAVDITGSLKGTPIEGKAVAVSPRSGFVLFGLGLSFTDTTNHWESTGQQIFDGLLTTIKFTDSNAACPISSDETYGYKEDNPIKVGGGDFGGPSRERAYLDHLRGPNGEQLTYERNGSTMSGDTILDIYHVTGSGLDLVLYIDEYNFSDLQAPVGFTCSGAFPLSAP